jgi:nucleotide-binding universal stress UspA family protein
MRPLALRNVLVATDLSDALLPALRSAAELARLAEAHLYVVHAEEKPGEESALSRHLSAAGVAPAVVADARTLKGPAGALIAQEAWRTEADVIVLGPHRPRDDNILGSTADRVVRAAPAPCLILPTALPLPLDRVLVPVDVTEGATGILEVGMAWASALRRRNNGAGVPTTLVALHVLANESESASRLAALKQQIKGVDNRLAHVAGVEVREQLEHGNDAASQIIKEAEAGHCDLLVLGTRGKRVTNGELLGSVSSAVVRRAQMPVLLVPPTVWLDRAGEPLS